MVKILRGEEKLAQPTRKKGVEAQIEAVNQFNPQQQQALQELLQKGLGSLGNLNLPGMPLQGQGSFAPIAQNAQRQFQQNTVPGLAERFTSMGSGAALSSPDLNRQLSGAGADLASQLAALEAQYGLQQQGLGLQEQGMQNANLWNLLQQGLNPQEQFIHHGAQERAGSGFGNFFRNNLPQILQLGGQVAGGAFGGPMGAQLGGQIGGGVGQGFAGALGHVGGGGQVNNIRGFNNPSQFGGY